MRFLIVYILFLCLLGIEFGFGKEWKRVKIAIEPHYPPYSYVKKDGEIGGMEIKIARALCREMRVRCEYYKQDWDGLIPSILSRKYDAFMAAMPITEERKRKIGFSEPYFSSGSAFMGQKRKDILISKDMGENRINLKGKRIGVQISTTQEYYLNDYYADVIEIRKYVDNRKVVLDLLSGRIDLGFMDSLVAYTLVKSYKDLGVIEPIFFDREVVGDGIAIGMRKGSKGLNRMINNALNKIRKNGVYKKIVSQYLTNDQYKNMIKSMDDLSQ